MQVSSAGGTVSFVPETDLTLRQVHVGSGYVSSDGDLDTAALIADANKVLPKFVLSSEFGFPFSQLAFPVPKGTPVFLTSASVGGSTALLIFS